jgi:hypothetical protein
VFVVWGNVLGCGLVGRFVDVVRLVKFGFYLYVGVAIPTAPQDGLWVALRFGFWLFFFC